jgi:NADH-quinone oxidoreductase subunit L
VPEPVTPFVPPAVHGFWSRGWGFDALYGALWVRPYEFSARVASGDIVDLWPRAVAAVTRGLSRALRTTQTGRLRWYLAGLALGAVVGIVVVVR